MVKCFPHIYMYVRMYVHTYIPTYINVIHTLPKTYSTYTYLHDYVLCMWDVNVGDASQIVHEPGWQGIDRGPRCET